MSVTIEMNILIFIAMSFIAGLLSFLSPCTLPVLPAYFAYTCQSKKGKLTLMTVSFFLGLALTFSLMGMLAAFAGATLRENISLASRIFGAVIIAFGIALLLGRGFHGIKRVNKTGQGFVSSFVFGIAIALGWSPCVGPILGSMLLLASTSGTAAIGGFLLFIYAAGLATPLFLISLFFDRLDENSRLWRFIRGREFSFSLFGRTVKLHTTTTISAVILIVLGLLMLFNTLEVLSALFPRELQIWTYDLESGLLQ